MSENTKDKITEAAVGILNDDPSAALERIAEKAGVTRRTLHRHFTDRADLIHACGAAVHQKCKAAMYEALASSKDPLVQLENILYAGIDCGAKYSLFHKTHMKEDHHHHHDNEDCADFDSLSSRFAKLITTLIDKGKISNRLSVEWIKMFFASVVEATVNSSEYGVVANKSLKQFAWFSFSKGIGL
jgi:AcrR family transcriptional regulator